MRPEFTFIFRSNLRCGQNLSLRKRDCRQEIAMTDERPWWFSEEEEEQPSAGKSLDLWALLGSVQRLAGWAQQMTAEQVLAPHAEHTDPSAHPTCLVCRTMAVLADVRGFADPGGSSIDEDTTVRAARTLWLKVHRGPCKR
jgi:hypothetical protein